MKNKVTKKKIAYLIIAMLLLTYLSGCTAQIPERTVKQYKIGVTVYDEYDTYVSSITKYMSEWCKEKEKEAGVSIALDVVGASGSQFTQNNQVEKFIAKNYDAICVNLVDRTDPTQIIDKAREADIPVIFFNRELVKADIERWDKLFYVGSDAEESGKLQAQIIIDELSDPVRFSEIDVNHNGVIQYVMLEGEHGHQDALIRTKTCIEEIKAAGFHVEKIDDEVANWNKDQAATKMKAMLDKYPIQIEMVIANDDDMALGALKAITENKASIVPYIIGINGTDEALEAVRTRKIDGTVLNDAKGQAEAAMKIAYNFAAYNTAPKDIDFMDGKYVLTPYTAITYDNVQDYISK